MFISQLYKTYKRALIKRFEGLPNVASFRTEKLGVHEYAAVYGVNKSIKVTESKALWDSYEPNLYLERQMARITKHALEGNWETAYWLADRLLKRSVTFRILALNRVSPEWFTWEIRALRKTWRALSHLCRTGATDLKSRRFWIEKRKGSGIYDRPIGAPYKEWRMYAFMQTDLMERLMQAGGHLAPWQHAGRSSKGLVTAWEALIPRLRSARFMYEFDLKGFFDNVRHTVIENLVGPLIGKPLNKLVMGILGNRRPTEVYLPPQERDQASERYAARLADLREAYPDYFDPEVVKYLQEEAVKENPSIAEEYSFTRYFEDMLRGVSEYPNLNERGAMLPLYPIPSAEGVDQDRAEARERWKALNLDGKGVPQGLSWSPLIATAALTECVNFVNDFRRKAINPSERTPILGEGNLLMYMDDGLLMADSQEDLDRLRGDFEAALNMLGVSLAPEKSGMIKEEGTWKRERFKFLGLEYVVPEDNLKSKTRAGTEKYLPGFGRSEIAGQISTSPYSNRRRELDELVNTKAYEAGLKYGFLGCLISDAMDPNTNSENDKKRSIREGQEASWARILESRDWVSVAGYRRPARDGNFLWKTQDLYEIHRESLEGHLQEEDIRKLSLTNASSVATSFFTLEVVRELYLRPNSRATRARKERLKASIKPRYTYAPSWNKY